MRMPGHARLPAMMPTRAAADRGAGAFVQVEPDRVLDLVAVPGARRGDVVDDGVSGAGAVDGGQRSRRCGQGSGRSRRRAPSRDPIRCSIPRYRAATGRPTTPRCGRRSPAAGGGRRFP
jgi:hypothetical protein